jgi:hypothetical protein
MEDLFQRDNLVRAVARTVATIDTDLWLVFNMLPKDSAKRAGFGAVAAADTAFRI